jgi:hypothetical protein
MEPDIWKAKNALVFPMMVFAFAIFQKNSAENVTEFGLRLLAEKILRYRLMENFPNLVQIKHRSKHIMVSIALGLALQK